MHVEERLELDLLVAQHVRVGGAAGLVFGEEVAEHPVPVLGGEVHRLQRDVQHRAHGAHHLEVLLGGAMTCGVVLFPVLHEQAGDGVALLPEQQGSDRRIDAAREADHHVRHAQRAAAGAYSLRRSRE
jgi:hypothetical protein